MVERSETKVMDMPPFSQVDNRVEVVFDGAEPVVFADVVADPCEGCSDGLDEGTCDGCEHDKGEQQ